MKHEIKLNYTRHVTFEIDDDDVYNAYRRAVEKLTDGEDPDNEDMPEYELEGVKVGDREIEVSFDLDFRGPKDAQGLSPWEATLRDRATYKEISSGYDLAPLLRAAFSEQTTA